MSGPFYVIGHNPNTLPEVKAFLGAGANALEPDVNVYANDSGWLCISHGEGAPNAPRLTDFFDDLHKIAADYPNFALVYLDTKPLAAQPMHAPRILTAVRNHLIGTGSDRVNLKVIYSVAEYADAMRYFPALAKAMNDAGGQQANEGVMIDYERDAARVSRTLDGYGLRNHCFGFGNSAPIAPVHIHATMQAACQYRDQPGSGLAQVYAWTFNAESSQENRIDEGVNGIIVDQGSGLDNIKRLLAQGRGGNRIATRADNPFGG